MESLVYINSLSDNIFVSSPLTIKESIAVVFVSNKTHTAWFNNYVLKRWLLGYESVLSINDIPLKTRQVFIPCGGTLTYKETKEMFNKCETLSEYCTIHEQERIWKWVHLHQKNK